MSTKPNHTSADAKTKDEDTNVTPIVPEQAKAETGEKTVQDDVETNEPASKLDKLKDLAQRNKKALVAFGLAAAVTALAVVNARKNYAAQVEETDEAPNA